MTNLPTLTTVYLGLGSNKGNVENNLNEALARLEVYGSDIRLKQLSEIYMTEPQGPVKDQPWFANQVVRLEIDHEIWAPEGFLTALTAIEGQMGRKRTEEGGPRVIDLDLLLWGDLEMDNDFLTLPHPRLAERAFVLIPLAEVAPEDFRLPDGRSIPEALSALPYRQEGGKIWQNDT